jgi:hypothetical protein
VSKVRDGVREERTGPQKSGLHLHLLFIGFGRHDKLEGLLRCWSILQLAFTDAKATKDILEVI